MQINISVSNILNFRGGGKIVAINDGFLHQKHGLKTSHTILQYPSSFLKYELGRCVDSQ